MADLYIDLQIQADSATMADNALDVLREAWPGWEGNDGDMEVVQIEAHSTMTADAATAAGQVPAAVFQEILSDLHGVVLQEGTEATTTVTFTMLDPGPYLIEEGTEIDIDGYAFTIDWDTPVAAMTVPGVPVTAAEVGADYNDLAGDVVTPITSMAFVAEVTVDTPTAGGTDPESDVDLLDRGSRELQLQAKTLITTRDYELWALSYEEVERVIATQDTANRKVIVTASGPGGAPLATATKNTILADYANYRSSTWLVSMADATLTTVNVAYTVKILPGYTIADVTERITDTLTDWLDPDTWGNPQSGLQGGSTTWLLEPVVRKNAVIDVIGNVLGVRYVVDLTLSGTYSAKLSSTLSTGAAITSLPITGLVNTIPSGAVITLTSSDGLHTQNFTTTAQVNAGATTIPVTSQTPNFAYTNAATIAGPVLGDFTMPGTVPLPTPGAMTGTFQ
jgi:hypothetical protein